MEGFNPIETIKTKEEIVALIIEYGLTPEIIEMVTKWRESEDTKIQTPREQLVINIAMLEFYEASGNAEDGLQDAKETLFQARATEGCDDLIDQILVMYPYLDTLISIDEVEGPHKQPK
jgi:hypothetical protein